MVISPLADLANQYLPLFVVIQARVSAFFAAAFFFRRELVPARIMLAVAFVISVYITMLLKNSASAAISYSILPLLLQQIFLGFLSGIVINFFVEIFLGFGQVISMQAGLGMVQMYVPKLGSVTPLTNFFVLTATLIFFQLNGHLLAIKLIVNSFIFGDFHHTNLSFSSLKSVMDFSAIIFSGALMLSLSVVITILLTNFTIGVMSKFSPQINIFSVGINISLIICLFAVYVSYDLIVENGEVLLNDILEFLRGVMA